MKTATYLAFIAAAAFALLMLALKLNIIPAMKTTPDALDGREVLILDAGHGGEDGGAVASDGTEEASLNLAVAQKTELIASFFGVDVIMTRRSAEIDYPETALTVKTRKTADQKARLALINRYPNAVLISIHQNKYTGSGPRGAQAFFAGTDGSRELAEMIQQLFCRLPTLASDRVAMKADNGIYLMKNAECTAVLAECGFISNPEELELLKSNTHQTNIAAALSAAYLSTRFDSGVRING